MQGSRRSYSYEREHCRILSPEERMPLTIDAVTLHNIAIVLRAQQGIMIATTIPSR